MYRMSIVLLLIVSGLSTAILSPSSPVAAGTVTYSFEDGVCQEDRALIQQGIELAQWFLAEHAGGDVQGAVNVDARAGDPGTGPAAEARDHTVIIRTGHPVWSSTSARNRVKISVHEYVHILQLELERSANRQPVGPTWLLEGVAEYLAFQAAIADGRFPADDVLAYHVAGVLNSTPPLPPLEDLETSTGFYSTQGSTYSLGYLAAEQALGNRSLESFRAFYLALGNGTPWRSAFQDAFGQSVDTFYSAFETYRSNLTPLPISPDYWGSPPPCTDISPQLTLSPTSGQVNRQVNVGVSDFSANEEVTITWDGQVQTTVTTSSSGEGSGAFRAPAAPMGPHTVRATGELLSSSATFTIVPRIKVIPSVAGRGDVVNISLRGYVARETVRIRWLHEGTWVEVARVTTSNTGSKNVDVTVPTWATDGPQSIRGDSTVSTGGRAQTNAFTVEPSVAGALVLSSTRGTVNSRVTANVSGFPPDTEVSVTFPGFYVASGSAVTDSAGQAAVSLRVPASPKGVYTVFASGGGTEATASYEIVPRIKLIPSAAERGAMIEVSLRGFGARESVRIRWKNGDRFEEIAVAPTSGSGSANINIVVPAWAPDGPAVVRGDGPVGRAQTSAFTVTGGPSVQVEDAAIPAATATATPAATASPEVTPTPSVPDDATPVPTLTPGPAATSDPTAHATVTATPTEPPAVTPTQEPLGADPPTG